MMVIRDRFEKTDGTSYPQITVSEPADMQLFEKIASAVESEIEGQWKEKLTSPDQCYWDYESEGEKVTLHYEHYLGITVFPKDGEHHSPKSLDLLEKIYQLLLTSPSH